MSFIPHTVSVMRPTPKADPFQPAASPPVTRSAVIVKNVLHGLEDKDITLTLTDIQGNPVYLQRLMSTEGGNPIQIASLPEGIYIWQAADAAGIVHQGKLVVQ